MACVGRFKRIYKHGRVAGAIQETSPTDILGGQGADFLRRVPFWNVKSFRLAKMILKLHDRCSTSYDLASLFRGRRSTLQKEVEK